jgi:hypothetical protein
MPRENYMKLILRKSKPTIAGTATARFLENPSMCRGTRLFFRSTNGCRAIQQLAETQWFLDLKSQDLRIATQPRTAGSDSGKSSLAMAITLVPAWQHSTKVKAHA